MESGRKPSLTTVDSKGKQKTWTKTKSKKTGAHNTGYHSDEYLGFYEDKDKHEAYVKQDKSANNIAEFLAGRIYQTTIPGAAANIYFSRIPTPEKISEAEVKELGSNVCVVSEFIPGATSDLYTDIQRADNKDSERSSVTAIEMLQIFSQMRNLDDAFEKNKYQNFAQVMVSSLLQNNIDTHVGNLMVIPDKGITKRDDKGKDKDKGAKKLGIIDFGAAWMKMAPKIRPHSFLNIFLGHLGEAWNNFLFYPESLKITPYFVAELDRVANIDLRPTIEDAFKIIDEFYETKPIIEFAIRAELVDKKQAKQWLEQQKSKDEVVKKEVVKKEVVNEIVNRCVDIMQKRQADLLRFSAQIKLDLLCKAEDENKIGVTGSFSMDGKKQITIYDVAFQHIDYFKEVLSGEEKLKFRQKEHKKNSALLQGVQEEMVLVVASLIVAESPSNRRLDDIVAALQDGRIKGKNILKLCGEGRTKPQMIDAAKKIFSDQNSLVGLAKFGGLRKENAKKIISLIREGSNPDLSMPGGRKLIDHAKDAETRLLLVKHGASLPRLVDKTEKAVLVKERQRYLRRTERQAELGRFEKVATENSDSYIDLSLLLNHIKTELLNKKWNTVIGNEVVVTVVQAGKEPSQKVNVVPDGIKKILDVIHQAEIDSKTPINKDNPQIWIDALEEIKIIACKHGSYSAGKMFFFGQDKDTKSTYNKIDEHVTFILSQIQSHSPRSKPQ